MSRSCRFLLFWHHSYEVTLKTPEDLLRSAVGITRFAVRGPAYLKMDHFILIFYANPHKVWKPLWPLGSLHTPNTINVGILGNGSKFKVKMPIGMITLSRKFNHLNIDSFVEKVALRL